MENFKDFIKPELGILIPALYFVGICLKKSKLNDKYIPITLGLCGIALSVLYVCGKEGFNFISVFTAITQGILSTGCSIYINQLIKQQKKS